MLLQSVSKQWGENVGGGGQTVSLPISFEVAFTAVVSADSSWCNASCHITTTTITTMNYQSNRPDIAQAGPVQWLAIGIQPQWGYQTVHGTNPVTYDLPIPFEEAPFTVAISTGNSGNHASCGGFTKTTIVLRAGTTAGVWDTVGFFIIGCQLQWGFTVFDPVYYKNVNFTLPLSVNGTFCAFSTGYDAKGSTFLWHSMSHFNNVNVGVTGFVFDSRYTFTGLGYLAVCWQKQWGSSASLSGYVAVCIFPISFTTTDYTAVATGVMSAADATFGKENYVNNILWDFTSESQVAFRLSHLDRPTLKYIAIGF